MPRRKAQTVHATPDNLLILDALSFESPESSTIASATYDPDTETMKLWFKREGQDNDCYTFNIPGKVWIDFEQAKSKGAHFARFIRPLYSGRKQ